MDEGMAPARALKTTSLLVATTGAVLLCAGIVMTGWSVGVAAILATPDAHYVIWASGAASIGVGCVALIAAGVMRRLARRITQDALAVRKLARQLVAEASARAESSAQPEVPVWALRTPPHPGTARPLEPGSRPAASVNSGRGPHSGDVDDGDESPAERTDTWAAIDAMRADGSGRKRKSA